MSENNGAHGESGATDDIDNTTGAGNAPNGAGSAASGAASTDASLESRAKAAKQGFNWWVVAVIAIVAVVAVVLGVTLFKPKSDAGGNAAADSGSSAGTVTIGLKLAPTNLDIRNQSGSSLDQVLIGNVYEGLVARDSDNQVVPAIAKSWDESSDGLTYTFHLNSGMTFSNGDALTAEDVVWSINDLIKNQYHDADSLSMVKSVEAQGDDAVVLTLKCPGTQSMMTPNPAV